MNMHRSKNKDTQEFKYLVEVMTLPQAFSEPEHAEYAARALAIHWKYLNEGDKIGAACALCCKPWTLKFAPASLLHVTPMKGDQHVISLVCARCAHSPKLNRKVLKELKGLGYDFQKVNHMTEEVGTA